MHIIELVMRSSLQFIEGGKEKFETLFRKKNKIKVYVSHFLFY